jgi:hypothetical protein
MRNPDHLEKRPVRKPSALLECFDLAEEIFATLKGALHVEDHYMIDLSSIDAAPETLSAPYDVAAFAMRKAQALRRLATPGTPTSNDVVVTVLAELSRVLEEAAPRRPHVEGDRLLEMRDKIAEAAREVCAMGGPGNIVIMI